MPTPNILVGCPVARRDWILPFWFDHVEEAFRVVGKTPAYTFVLDMADEETYACIQAHTDMLDRFCFIRHVPEPDLEARDRRTWNPDRYLRMVFLRNRLLEGVRRYKPPYFLSLDSDILLHPQALSSLLQAISDPERPFDAVATKAYLGPGKWLPTYANHDGQGGMRRTDVDYLCPAQIIMAAKLMSPAAYAIDYAWDHQGEDIGWSDACRAAGLKLGFDGRYTSEHIMERGMLHE